MRQAVVDTTTLSTHRRPEPNLPLCVIPVGALFSPFLIYQPISQSIRPSVSPLKDIEGRRFNPTTPCQPKIDLPKHAHTKRRTRTGPPKHTWERTPHPKRCEWQTKDGSFVQASRTRRTCFVFGQTIFNSVFNCSSEARLVKVLDDLGESSFEGSPASLAGVRLVSPGQGEPFP